MKLFHISDVLSVTTGRLVSFRHMDGIYEILNFLTGDSLYTHQLPRAMRECEPWIRTQFPDLMEDSPAMTVLLKALDDRLAPIRQNRDEVGREVADWVEIVRGTFNLPADLPVYELGADMHTRIDPVAELEAMVGADKVIVIRSEENS